MPNSNFKKMKHSLKITNSTAKTVYIMEVLLAIETVSSEMGHSNSQQTQMRNDLDKYFM